MSGLTGTSTMNGAGSIVIVELDAPFCTEGAAQQRLLARESACTVL